MNINKILAAPGYKACDQYGSSMGRRNRINGIPEKLHLQRMRFVGYDYDAGGAYWGGRSDPMYCAFSDKQTENEFPIMVFVRGRDRDDAKKNALEVLPGEGWSFF